MNKADIKLLCENDTGLQWWAMLLFAEISEAYHNLEKDPVLLRNYVKTKVEEFPVLIVQEQISKAKIALQQLKEQKESK